MKTRLGTTCAWSGQLVGRASHGDAMTGTTVLAWESGNWAWNQFGHGLGHFLISPGLAGGAAVVAAYLAARQVQKTREQDKVTKQLESLWKRFEWVVDRSIPKSNGGGAVLGVRRTMAILASIRVSARTLGDDHLHDMIGTYMENELAESSGIALTAQ